jgi:hypothetical protein
VALSAAEAFCGCKIPVGVPVFGACQECGGTGAVFPFRCLECAGSGLVEEQRTRDHGGGRQPLHKPERVPRGLRELRPLGGPVVILIL